MDQLYPASPVDVPSDLTRPSARYRYQAWLAVSGLALFLGAYLGLAGWLAWTSFRLFSATGNGADDSNIFVALGAGFLSVFLFKAIIFVKRGQPSDDLEIKQKEQPRLIAFIYKLAGEIGAPRPRRVYLSPRVNACVFFDLSPLNFIIPSRKNLEVGLGLVNVLNIGEFKAVLAHEFGHFAQRTMAVGRWVYVSQQIAAHIVAKRDVFDKFLEGVSRLDFRIAWVGWLFRLIIWSIRSLVELMFLVVALAEKALSREMEFQADLVAVSVTGSDPIVNALHKLSAADDAWGRAVSFARAEKQAGRPTNNIFRLQDRVLVRLRELYGDSTFGATPKPPSVDAQGFRVFKASLAAPPQMWATHPANSDREENAKRRYIPASVDDRSAWELFDNADALRASMSERVLGKSDSTIVPPEEMFGRLDEQYRASFLKPEYRGVYYGRSIVRHARKIGELYGIEPSEPLLEIESLYPAGISEDVESGRKLGEEVSLLKGLVAGSLRASGEKIRFRGRDVSRQEVPRLRTSVEAELASVESRLRDHDRRCRSAHVALARRVGQGWDDYLRGLLAIHHYAAHVEAVLDDAIFSYRRTLQEQLARANTRKPDIDVVLAAAKRAYAALAEAHREAQAVEPDVTLLQRLAIKSWAEHMQELKLSEPTTESLGDWVKVFDSWADSASSNLAFLRFSSLEQLLDSERAVVDARKSGTALPNACSPSAVPSSYPTLLPGEGHAQWKKQSWSDRLFGASSPAEFMLRLCAAATVIGLVVWGAETVGHATVNVFNGLERFVHVTAGSVSADLAPHSHALLQVGDADKIHIRTTTSEGTVIEEFDAKATGRGAHDIYNVAGAGVLVSWTAVYGDAQEVPPRIIGAPRWVNAHAEVEFEDPPRSIQTKGGGGTRSVLSGLGGQEPERVLGPISGNPAEVSQVVHAHAQWDSPSEPYAAQWREIENRIAPTDFASH